MFHPLTVLAKCRIPPNRRNSQTLLRRLSGSRLILKMLRSEIPPVSRCREAGRRRKAVQRYRVFKLSKPTADHTGPQVNSQPIKHHIAGPPLHSTNYLVHNIWLTAKRNQKSKNIDFLDILWYSTSERSGSSDMGLCIGRVEELSC